MIVEESATALAAVAEDFGHVVHGSPTGLVRPSSPGEVALAAENKQMFDPNGIFCSLLLQ